MTLPVRPKGVDGFKTWRARLEATPEGPVVAPAAPSNRDDLDLILDQ